MYKTSGGIPCFVTTCDKFQPWIDNGQNKEPLLSKRVENTITEQAFDVVIADKKNKIISAVRLDALLIMVEKNYLKYANNLMETPLKTGTN